MFLIHIKLSTLFFTTLLDKLTSYHDKFINLKITVSYMQNFVIHLFLCNKKMLGSLANFVHVFVLSRIALKIYFGLAELL